VPAWFEQHIVTMDLLTARYLAARGWTPETTAPDAP
jgi:hypothetical protein